TMQQRVAHALLAWDMTAPDAGVVCMVPGGVQGWQRVLQATPTRRLHATPNGRLHDDTTRSPTVSPRRNRKPASTVAGSLTMRLWPRPSVLSRRAPGQWRA